MSGLFSSPDTPKAAQEDPAVKAQREEEQRRAEEERQRALQDQLGQQTQQRKRRLGSRSLFGPNGLGGLSGKLGSG